MSQYGIRFSILDLGIMKSDINLVALGSVTATRSNPEAKTYMIDVPIDSVLIDVPGYGKILYDLGCDPKGMSEHWPESINKITPYYQKENQTLEYQIGLLGLKPEDIRTVILSHMHVDHAGYLYLFPHAEVIVQEKEFSAALTYAFEQLDQEGHTLYMRQDLTAPVDRYTLINGDYEVCPGVKCISLPGHSAGMMGLQIELDHGGTYFFARDAAYLAVNYGPPLLPASFMYNLEDYYASHEKLRKLEKETGGKVIFSHDMKQWSAMKHAPEYYN